MSSISSNLLEEALGLENGATTSRVLLIEDSVETSGNFVLHHLLKRSLAPQDSTIVIFVALAHPFSHYDRIFRKLACNLVTHRSNNRFIFLDMLKLDCLGEITRLGEDGSNTTEGALRELYGHIQKTVEVSTSLQNNQASVTIMIDDVSLLEVATHGSANYVLDFLHYCHTFTSELACLLVLLNHEDIYSSTVAPRFLLQLEYLADIIIRAEPLSTGLAADVHGQLTVMSKGILTENRHMSNKIRNFHFKINEHSVEYFHPGSRV